MRSDHPQMRAVSNSLAVSGRHPSGHHDPFRRLKPRVVSANQCRRGRPLIITRIGRDPALYVLVRTKDYTFCGVQTPRQQRPAVGVHRTSVWVVADGGRRQESDDRHQMHGPERARHTLQPLERAVVPRRRLRLLEASCCPTWAEITRRDVALALPTAVTARMFLVGVLYA